MAWPKSVAAILVCACLAALGMAQESAPSAQPSSVPSVTSAAEVQKMTPAERDAKARALHKEFVALLKQKDCVQAEAKCRDMIVIVPDSFVPYFNLGVALAMQGKKEDALAALKAAADRGFADPDLAQNDPYLTALRGEKAFNDFVDLSERNVEAAEKNLPCDQGIEIKGVRTVEKAPEGGLRYRVRMSPNATREKTNRLILWLHPMGGSSCNRLIEPMAPLLIQHGYALLVPTQKRFTMWTMHEAQRLVNVTLADAAKIEGISGDKPILLGFSNGGQVSLTLWAEKPAAFGGIIVDAAYPVTGAQVGEAQRLELMAFPNAAPGVKPAPIFAIVGGKDDGLGIWQKVAPGWRAAGAAVTVHVVPGRGHEWLFGANQQALLTAWLDAISRGERPSDPDPASASTPAPSAPSGPSRR